jgi:hypothetical protein
MRSDNLAIAPRTSLYLELAVMAEVHRRYILELVDAHLHKPYSIITRFTAGKSLFNRIHIKDADLISHQKMTVPINI